MTPIDLQQSLFKTIRSRIGETPLAEEIAGILDISTDSAYRRLRGEKLITLEELLALCSHYQLSLDQLMNIQQPGIVFQGQYMDKHNFRFEEYLGSMLQNMTFINGHKERTIFYLCKDLPIFHQYHIRDIAAFKWFVYLKTYFQFPGFEKKKFRFSEHPDDIFILEEKIRDIYNQVPSVEIWNFESMNIFFRQIEFYRDSGVFESDSDVYRLYEAMEKLWQHLEKQASLGYKFNYQDAEQKPMGEYKMYFNEVLLGDNNILVILDGVKVAYVSHTTINFMLTRDKGFTDNFYQHIQTQIKRSTLISEVSEKERNRFFRIIRDKIVSRKQALAV
jgi:hypothetical protein